MNLFSKTLFRVEMGCMKLPEYSDIIFFMLSIEKSNFLGLE